LQLLFAPSTDSGAHVSFQMASPNAELPYGTEYFALAVAGAATNISTAATVATIVALTLNIESPLH